MHKASSPRLLNCLVIAVSTLAIMPAYAQDSGSRMTREFVNAAAQSDDFERMEATTALAQSSDADVRHFATEMLAAHVETSRALMDAVARTGLMPPQPGLNGDQSAFLAALQSARGKDFDQLYIKQQMLPHRAALTIEQVYAADGDVTAVRQVAASTVAVISEHLHMADQLSAKLRSN